MILPLTEKDFSQVVKSKNYGYQDEWNENMLNSAVKNANFYGLKIMQNGEMAGYIHYSFSIDALDINSVFVFPNFRKKGLGEKLIQEVIAEAKSKKIDKIFLEVRESNASAISLYEKLGWSVVGVRKKYYPCGESAKIMLKEILL